MPTPTQEPTQIGSTGLSGPGPQKWPVDSITIGDRLRELDRSAVVELAESMRLRGQLQAIVITEDARLVFGYHRLEAAKLLGWNEIDARVMPLSPVEAELAELEENLVRSELTVLERGEHYCRRKALHEQLYPSTRRGGAPGLPGGGKAKTTGSVGFVRDTATRTGRAESVVREELRIGALPAEVKRVLRGTTAENDKGGLLSLTRMTGEPQLAAARSLAQGLLRKPGPRRSEASGAASRPDHSEALGGSPPEMLPPTGVTGAAVESAELLREACSTLERAVRDAPEVSRPSLAWVKQTAEQCAEFVEEYHIFREPCRCQVPNPCELCEGKRWLSASDKRRLMSMEPSAVPTDEFREIPSRQREP